MSGAHDAIGAARHQGIAVGVSPPQPDLLRTPLPAGERTRIGELPSADAVLNEAGINALLGQLIEPKISKSWVLIKRGADFLGALALLLVLLPVLGAIFALVARSGGKIIYGHRRMGRGGKWFTCYKFRTMVLNGDEVLARVLAENPAMREEWVRDEKLRKDPRVTGIGEFLRKTSLDELPQLFNVLVGDMSLVGPRPVAETGIARYGKAVRWYLAVRPGMTGLWQVSGRNDVEFRRRVVLDIYYVRSQSFLLDLQILLRTFRVVVSGSGY